MEAAAPPPRPCPNCGGPAPEPFCPRCGQAQRPLRVPFLRVLGEALDETLSLDSKLAHTLPALFLRPGEATRAWREGKRASHTSPLKVYLLASFVFFFATAVGPDFKTRAGTSGIQIGPAQVEPQGPVQAEPGELEAMRERGPVAALLAGHLERLQKLPPEEATRRLNAGMVDNAARAMFVLVPLAALVLLLLHARRGFYYTEHLTFTVHAQAVTFALLTPGVALASPVLTAGGSVLAIAHLLVAMRRFYGLGWPGTVVRWAVLSLAYLVLVVAGVLGATVVAVLSA
jgi:hypothetical protein